MKKIKNLIFLCLFVVGCVGLASADLAGYEIKDYQADFELTSEGILKARERLDINFTEPRHGIYRDIPFKYPKSDYLLKTPISNVVVLGYDFSDFENGNDYRIKIGSPNYKVNGNQFYDISYEIRGAVREFTGYQELYWNMLGTNWGIKIENFNFSVLLPSDLELEPETEFYAVGGARGSKDRVKLEKNGRKIQNAEPISLLPYEAITIAVKLPEKYVPVEEFREVIEVYQSQSISYQQVEEKGTSKEIGETRQEDWRENIIVYALLMIPILMVLVFLYFPLKYIFGMLYRLFFVLFIRKKQKIRDIIYYTPPKNLSVGEVAALYTRCPTYDSIFSTFYDRYARDLIVLGKNEWSKYPDLQRTSDIIFSGIGFEAMLWNLLFSRNTERIFSMKDFQVRNISLKGIARSAFDKTQKFYTARSLKIQGDFPIKNNLSRTGNSIAGGIFLCCWLSIFMMIFMDKKQVILFLIGGLFFVLFLAKMDSLTILEYTPKGLELYEQVLGFRKYLKTVEERKLKKLLEEDPSYFDKMLPYAVAFGMGTEWIEKCKVILRQTLQKSDFDDFEWRFWLLKDMQSGFDALARESQSSSSSSSSRDSSDFGSRSSFSGSGGSSGGGGGGGGGGSR